MACARASRTRLKQSNPARQGGAPRSTVISIALGFDKCCDKVWNYFQSEGLVFTGGLHDTKFQQDFKACQVGCQVMVYAPKSHGGKGLLGTGVIQSPLTKMVVGSQWSDDACVVRTRSAMQGIFGDPANENMFQKKVQHLNKAYKAHAEVLESCGPMSLWERGQSWMSDEKWQQFVHKFPAQYRSTYWLGSVRIRWEATVPFDMGLESVDCSVAAEEPFPLHSLRSVCVRYFSKGQIQSMLKALQSRATKASLGTDAGGLRSSCVKRGGYDVAPATPPKKQKLTTGQGVAPFVSTPQKPGNDTSMAITGTGGQFPGVCGFLAGYHPVVGPKTFLAWEAAMSACIAASAGGITMNKKTGMYSVRKAKKITKQSTHWHEVSWLAPRAQTFAGHAEQQRQVSDEQDGDNLDLFLKSLKLQRFAAGMMKEQIDMESLYLLSDQDLVSLGIPLGPRRKLQVALSNRIRR